MDFLQLPLFQALFNTSVPRVVLKADVPNFTIVTYNDAYKVSTHTQDRDIKGMFLWDAFNPDEAGGDGAKILRHALVKASETNQTVHTLPFHYNIPSANNPEKIEVNWWQLEILPIVGDDSKPEHLLITTNNITKQVLNQRTLDEGKRREQSLSDELSSVNEELAVSNEELSLTNEELNATIEELTQSQQNLQNLNEVLEERVKSRTKDLAESEAKFRAMVEQSPAAMLVNRGDDLIFEIINQPMLDLIDRDDTVIGKPWYQAIPELKGQPIVDRLYHTYRTGEPWTGTEVPINLNRRGKPIESYFNLAYKPLMEDGQIVGIIQSAVDVTEQVIARKQIETSEHRLKSMVMTTPIGMSILRGKEMRVEIANQPILDIWNRSLDDVLGNPLIEIFPDLVGQPFPKLLEGVLNNGKPISVSESEVYIASPKGNHKYIVDFTYHPLFDTDGLIDGIMVSVVDVTVSVTARKDLEQSQAEQQSLNEELLAINEELSQSQLDLQESNRDLQRSEREQQALNEELTATNEELASTNEELLTTNEELAQAQESLSNTVYELAESESKLRYMLSEAPVAIAVMSGRELTIESANKKVLEAWGKTPAIIGKPLHMALPELQGQDFLQILDNIFTTGEPFIGNEVKALLEQNGVIEEVYSNFVYQPIKNRQGEVTNIMLVANVITEQVLARKKVEQAEEMMRFSIEAANVGTWFLNTKTREFITSPRLKELFGYYPDEVVRFEDIAAQIPEDYRHKIEATIDQAISKGETYSMEHPAIGFHDQKLRWIRAQGKLSQDEKGEFSHFSGVLMDITEQKMDELRKNDFIGMVSHELKTPLTSLSAIVQMLHGKAKQNQDSFNAGALDKAITQVKKMSTMINGFLNVSRLEAGKILVDKQEFSLNDLLKETTDEHSLTALGHVLYLMPSDPIRVTADREKIASVVSNLLSNAVKYSPKGKNIEVRCAVVNNMAQVTVKDEGMGIKPHDIERLFERYYRVESNHTQHISGFGIGLYLSSEIIKRHDGNIWVESEPGVGSTFYFSLPLE